MEDDEEKEELQIIFTPENTEDYMVPVCLDDKNCSSEEFPCAWCLYVPLDASMKEVRQYIKEMKYKKLLKN